MCVCVCFPRWFAGRQGLPWSLSIIPSGVPLLAIISAVRSQAEPPPHHISLCQFMSCRWIEPQSPKLHVPIVNTYSDTCCFSPRLNRSAINSYFGTSVNFVFFKKKSFSCIYFYNLCASYCTYYRLKSVTLPLCELLSTHMQRTHKKQHCSGKYWIFKWWQQDNC